MNIYDSKTLNDLLTTSKVLEEDLPIGVLESIWLQDEDPKFEEFLEHKTNLIKTAEVLEETINVQNEAAKFLADRPDRPDEGPKSKRKNINFRKLPQP